MSAIAMILLLTSASAGAPVSWDLESDDGGFSAASFQWEWGVVGADLGPGVALSGSRCWATGLDRLYLNDIPDSLALPAMDLSAYDRPVVGWWQWLELAEGDGAWLEVRDPDSGSWAPVAPIYGYANGDSFDGGAPAWSEVFVDLQGHSDLSDLRLVFSPDATVQAAGWYVDDFTVWDGDAVSPFLSDLTKLGDTQDVAGPYVVEVTATDDVALESVTLRYWIDGEDLSFIEPMSDLGGGRYRGEIPGQSPDSTMEYYVQASDGVNLATLPEGDPQSFRVYLPAPTDLTGPEGRLNAREAELSWTPPACECSLAGYTVWRGDALVIKVDDPLAMVPLDPYDNRYTVTARFWIEDGALSEWEGDESRALSLDVAWPEISAVEPGDAYQGDTVRVVVTGANLLLVDGDIAVDLGEGITPLAIEVRDVDSAVITLGIDPDAATGPRDLWLSSGALALTAPDAFEVMDGAERPQLVAIEPSSIDQGESGELLITTAGAVGDAVSIDLGEGIVVESIAVDGDSIIVGVVVDPAAGLGEREVIVDDGQRILSGPSLEVLDRLIVTDKSCASGAGGTGAAGWLGLLGLLVSARRRRQGSAD